MSLLPVVLCMFALAMPLAHSADELAFMTHDLPPFVVLEGGQPKSGIALELFNETAQRMGQGKTALRAYPLARAIKLVQQRDNQMLFPVARIEERETLLKWVGPLLSNGVYVYKLRTNVQSLDTIDDLKRLPAIGVGNGNASMLKLQQKGLTNLHELNNEAQALKMLYMGRVDAVAMGELVFQDIMLRGGMDPARFEKTNIKLYDSTLYVAFSHNVPDEVVQRWQVTFDAVRRDRLAELIQKYVAPIAQAQRRGESH